MGKKRATNMDKEGKDGKDGYETGKKELNNGRDYNLLLCRERQ